MKEDSPFQAVHHTPPRLSGIERLNSLTSAAALVAILACTILVFWSWWVSHLRVNEEIPPIEVHIDPKAPDP